MMVFHPDMAVTTMSLIAQELSHRLPNETRMAHLAGDGPWCEALLYVFSSHKHHCTTSFKTWHSTETALKFGN